MGLDVYRKHLRILVLVFGPFLLSSPPFAQTATSMSGQISVVTTIGGNGEQGFAGDGGIATDAMMNLPGSVAVDSVGNVYFADLHNQRIRKIGANGIITTVAGNGQLGFSGDGGPATQASLNLGSPEPVPSGLVWFRYRAGIHVDVRGNIFIADTGNHRIRRVGLDGVIQTVVGGGSHGDGSKALDATLAFPSDVFIDDDGRMYIADTGHRSVRIVDLNGIVSTVASEFWLPMGVAVDGEGAVYVADSYFAYEGSVFKRDTTGQMLLVEYRNYSHTPPYWLGPSDVAVDEGGNIVVAHTNNQTIDRVLRNREVVRITGGGYRSSGHSENGTAADVALLSFPRGVAADRAGNVYIADTNNNRIKVVAPWAPTLTLRSTSCMGSEWSLEVGNAPPGSTIRLLGTSHGWPWELTQWNMTDRDGKFVEQGTFAESTRGIHTLRVEVGGAFSNPISFAVRDCQP